MTNHCTLDQSLALKEIGFEYDPILIVINDREKIANITSELSYDKLKEAISVPTRSEVLDWAREKHGIDAWVNSYKPNSIKIYQFAYDRNDGKGRYFDREYGYPTHPEAESALVDKIIELIKENIHKTEGK